MTIKYETRTIAVIVNKKDEPIFSEHATTISIEDDAGGEFVSVSQTSDGGVGKILINPDEWPALSEAIDDMINQCRSDT